MLKLAAKKNQNPFVDMFRKTKKFVLCQGKRLTKKEKARLKNLRDNEHTFEHKEMMLRKYLREKCEEEVIIDRARYNWQKIKKRLKIVHVMRNSSTFEVQ